MAWQGNDFMGTGAGQDGAEWVPGDDGARADEGVGAAGAMDAQGEGGGGGQSELEGLRARLSEAEGTLAEAEGRYMRLLADFQNHRNRQARDVQLGVEQAERQTLLEVLQVMDSFRRCLGSNYGSVEDFRAGVGLIERQFDAALRRLGVSEIDIGAGDAFDAHVAEALTTIAAPGLPPGSIVDVCEKGYRVGERLLRPARVVVAADGGGGGAP